MRRIPRINDHATVTDETSRFCGNGGQVVKVYSVKDRNDPDVRIAMIDIMLDDTNKKIVSVRRSNAAMTGKLAADDQARLVQIGIANAEKIEVETKEYERKRFERAINEYVENRVAATKMNEARRNDRGDYIEFDPFSRRPEYFSSSVTIYKSPAFDGVPRAEVNWSTIGCVSPEEALRFAQVLTAAAQEAMKIREEQEEKIEGLEDKIFEAMNA